MKSLFRIFDRDNWREIGATLGRNKTRTFLTAFGIFWGTAMLAMLSGGASGLRGMISRNFEGVATNMGAIFPGKRSISYRGFNKDSEVELHRRDADVIRAVVPEIDAMSSMVNNFGRVEHKSNSTTASILGIEADYSKIMLIVLHSGRLINEADVARNEHVCLIGKDLATQLFTDGTDPIGQYINAAGMYLKVIGIASQKAESVNMGGRVDQSVIVPFSTLSRAMNLGDRIYFQLFTVKEGSRVADAEKRIRRAISANVPIHPDDNQAVNFWDVSEMFEQIENVFLAVALLAFFVGGGTLIAGMIGVGNIMWIIVKERTQEIGIRRAIGARPSDIIIQTLSEGLVLTTVAGLAGIAFATIVLAVADHILTDAVHGAPGFMLTPGHAIGIAATFMVMGVLAGILPSLKAMKIKPVEAINDK